MKVCIFGASGATGILLTERCLAAGHEITVLLRRPDSFPLRDRVRVVEGNAFDPTAIRRALEGADAVLSALGARSLRREDVLERAVPLIVEAMQQTGVRRLEAVCHAENLASAHVLDKCGFQYEGIEREHTEFPNLVPGVRSDVLSYSLRFES